MRLYSIFSIIYIDEQIHDIFKFTVAVLLYM